MIAAALAKYLDSLGVGDYDESAAGGTLFAEHEPAQPDALVAVLGTGGNLLLDGGTHGWDEPTVQVIVRGAPHDVRGPYAVARGVYSQLQGLAHVVFDEGGVDEVAVVSVLSPQTEPFHLGADENGRHRYTINFALHVRAVTAHRG